MKAIVPKLHRPNFPYRLVLDNALSRTSSTLGLNRRTLLYLMASLSIGVVVYWRLRGWTAAAEEIIVAVVFGFAPFAIVSVVLLLWNLFHGFFIAPPPAQVVKPGPVVLEMSERTHWQRLRYLWNRSRNRIAREWRRSKKGF